MTPQSFKQMISLNVSPLILFLFLVMISPPALNTHSDGADVAGIARWDLAIYETIRKSNCFAFQNCNMSTRRPTTGCLSHRCHSSSLSNSRIGSSYSSASNSFSSSLILSSSTACSCAYTNFTLRISDSRA
jgi:hypothetical protein